MLTVSSLSALFLLTGFVQTETKLDFYKGDVKAGSGTYTEKFNHKGHKTSVFTLWGQGESGSTRTIIQVKVIDNKAFPISEQETITEVNGTNTSKLIMSVRYDSSGAAILDLTRDKVSITTRSYVPLPGLSRADPSDLWFSKTRPTVGTVVRSTVFDIENARWQRIETTYVGRRWITVGGHHLEVHEVRDVRDGAVRAVFLDEKGQPVLMKTGQFRTEKRF